MIDYYIHKGFSRTNLKQSTIITNQIFVVKVTKQAFTNQMKEKKTSQTLNIIKNQKICIL